MLKLKENEYKIQYSELNLKHRIFEEKSYVTIELITSFYPECYEKIIYGSIEIVVDYELNKLSDLENKKFTEGKVIVNLNEDGKWHTYDFKKFTLKFNKRTTNNIEFKLTFDECELKTNAHITSLYTVGNKNIENYFDMKDFYEKFVVKEITNKQIYKYFAKK